jgi:putative transposase
MCSVLGVSRAGFYRWKQRQKMPSDNQKRRHELLSFLLAEAKRQHNIPGYRKLWREAVDVGCFCSKTQVQRLLQSVGYRSCVATKPGYQKHKTSLPVLPNLLNRQFKVKKANRVWVSDITQIRCQEGWLYLAVVIDLATRQVVGRAQGPVNSSELVVGALKQAWAKQKLTSFEDGSKLLFHSDQGRQYHCEATMKWLTKKKITISMSRRGNCWDNACSESFFALLKKEWTRRLGFITRKEMADEIHFYIEKYYHKVRRHGALGELTPNAYAQQLKAA